MKRPKKYTDDPSLSWEERYKRLEAHHIEETEYLLAKLEDARAELKDLRRLRDEGSSVYLSGEEALTGGFYRKK